MPNRIVAPIAGWSQDKQRGYAYFYDQHKDDKYRDAAGDPIFVNGRPWGAVVERASNGAAMPMPVGPIHPVGWDAPWLPDQKYIVRSLGKIAQDGIGWLPGQGTSNRFRIDYEAMRREYVEAHAAYYEYMVNEHARLMPGARLPGPTDPIPYQIIAVVGRPPKSPKLPEAALGGNKWLLGQAMPIYNATTRTMEVEPDEQLARILKTSGVDLLTHQQTREMQGAQSDEVAEMKALLTKMLAEREQERIERASAARAEPSVAPSVAPSVTPVVKKSHKKKPVAAPVG